MSTDKTKKRSGNLDTPVINPRYTENLINTVNTSPFPSHMAMRLVKIEVDSAEMALQTSNCHLQPYGIVHGGVLATLIDSVTFWAVFLRIPEEDGLVNIDLKLNYLKPVIDQPLIAKGYAIRSGKSISYAEAKVYSPAGELFAHGTSTLMVVTGKGLQLGEKKFVWK